METVKTEHKKSELRQSVAETADFNFEEKNNEEVLYVLYGSRTGNSESAAVLACDYARYLGVEAYLLDMKTMIPENIRFAKNLLVAVSTHGEGDPPAVVEDFYNYLHGEEAHQQEGMRYSVLALGDSTYEDYCKTGHDIADRFNKLGAKEFSPLLECDIDYEENAMRWARTAVEAFSETLPKKNPVKGKTFAFEINKKDGDFDNAFFAPVLSKKMLTGDASAKRTMLLTLSLENSGLTFKPGDSLGVYTTNARMFVDKVLRTLKFDGTIRVEVNGEDVLLKEALIKDFELTVLTTVVVNKYFEVTQHPELKKLLDDPELTEHYCETRDVLDLVEDYPAEISPQQFVSILRKLNPRLYSVASSEEQNPDKVDIVAGLIEYTRSNRERIGVTSSLFSDRVEDGETLPVFIEDNPRFRLPEDNSTPVILIGAGTGIAPYRAFLQEIEKTERKNPVWLFFGEKHPEADFLFKEELEKYLSDGVLTKLNVAFSRRSAGKKYIQDDILEKEAEIIDWIEKRNANIYLCGNKRTMAKDVRNTLRQVFINQKKISRDDADAILQQLKADKRFQEDVY